MDASKSKAARAAFILKTSFLCLLKVKSNLNMFTLSTASSLCIPSLLQFGEASVETKNDVESTATN